MSGIMSIDPALICRVEQFYYREARILDNRRFLQWLTLLDPSIVYTMPSRVTPQRDNSLGGTDEFLAVEAELERTGPDALPLREENFAFLEFKVKKSLLPNAWAENPPPRTRRMVTNIEVEPLESNDYRTYSNTHMFYSSKGADNHHYILSRQDILRNDGDQFRIVRREVVSDERIITVPTLALFF